MRSARAGRILTSTFRLVLSAKSVLDVGCGTGELLRLARQAGHTGRLCGLDPAEAMLEQARKRWDVEWVHGDLSAVDWDREFDLIVMTGHAFQVLVEDAQLRTSLAAIRTPLTDDGRFVFETRNPSARGWEAWTPDNAVEISHGSSVVRMAHQVETPVERDCCFVQRYLHQSKLERPFGQPEHVEVSRCGLALRVLVGSRVDSRGTVRGLGQAATDRYESGDHHRRATWVNRA